jgi:arginase family enzyme
VALIHFDAHLDTWDTYFNAPVTHGTIFRRAFEEGLLVEDHSIYVGIRGPIYGREDLAVLTTRQHHAESAPRLGDVRLCRLFDDVLGVGLQPEAFLD